MSTEYEPPQHRRAARAGSRHSGRPGRNPDRLTSPGHLYNLHIRQMWQQHRQTAEIAPTLAAVGFHRLLEGIRQTSGTGIREDAAS